MIFVETILNFELLLTMRPCLVLPCSLLFLTCLTQVYSKTYLVETIDSQDEIPRVNHPKIDHVKPKVNKKSPVGRLVPVMRRRVDGSDYGPMDMDLTPEDFSDLKNYQKELGKLACSIITDQNYDLLKPICEVCGMQATLDIIPWESEAELGIRCDNLDEFMKGMPDEGKKFCEGVPKKSLGKVTTIFDEGQEADDKTACDAAVKQEFT